MDGSTSRTISCSVPAASGTRGFTLIEVMISVGLVSVVLLALGVATMNFGQNSMSFQRALPAAVQREQFQDFFSKLAENAWVSTQFLHEPVSWSAGAAGGSCSGAGDVNPCVRRQGWSEGGTFVGGETTFMEVSTVPTAPAGSYIDFFRDEYSDLTSTQVYPVDNEGFLIHSMGADAAPSGTAAVPFTGANTPIPEGWLQTDYYASWRLDTPTSPPFFILSQYPSRNAFVLVSSPVARQFKFAPTDPSVADYAGTLAATDPALRSALATAITSGLMLVYNSADPRQYAIQYIYSAAADAGDANFLFQLDAVNLAAPHPNPIEAGTPQAWYNSTAAYNAYTWGGGSCSNVWAATQNDPGGNGFYLFPSQFFSFCSDRPVTGAAPNWTVANPFTENPASQGIDFAQILNNYYHLVTPGGAPGPAPAGATLTPLPQFIGIPLIATAFFLGTGVIPPGCNGNFPLTTPVQPGCPPTASFYSLQSITLPGPAGVPIQRTHIGMVSPNLVANTAPVYFGRKLGTSKIEAFVK